MAENNPLLVQEQVRWYFYFRPTSAMTGETGLLTGAPVTRLRNTSSTHYDIIGLRIHLRNQSCSDN